MPNATPASPADTVDYSEATFTVADRVGTFEIKGKVREIGWDYYGRFTLRRSGPVTRPES